MTLARILAELPALAVPLPFVTALLACGIAARLMAGAFGSAAGRRFFTALFYPQWWPSQAWSAPSSPWASIW